MKHNLRKTDYCTQCTMYIVCELLVFYHNSPTIFFISKIHFHYFDRVTMCFNACYYIKVPKNSDSFISLFWKISEAARMPNVFTQCLNYFFA